MEKPVEDSDVVYRYTEFSSKTDALQDFCSQQQCFQICGVTRRANQFTTKLSIFSPPFSVRLLLLSKHRRCVAESQRSFTRSKQSCSNTRYRRSHIWSKTQ